MEVKSVRSLSVSDMPPPAVRGARSLSESAAKTTAAYVWQLVAPAKRGESEAINKLLDIATNSDHPSERDEARVCLNDLQLARESTEAVRDQARAHAFDFCLGMQPSQREQIPLRILEMASAHAETLEESTALSTKQAVIFDLINKALTADIINH
jgi:hypothetical protein